MKFRFGNPGDTASELRKTLEYQLLHIVSLLDPLRTDTGEAVHATRQTCKKCRAILRLMRDALGYASYFRENNCLKEMQKELAPVRDAHVQYELFTRISENHPRLTADSWYAGIVEKARRDFDLELNGFKEGEQASRISGLAGTAAERIKLYQTDGQGFGIVKDGLARTYRQGRETGKCLLQANLDAREIHQFRKKAKYLQYQLSYLKPIFKGMMKAMSTEMEQITENLGRCNDLHLACLKLREFSGELKRVPKAVGLLTGRLEEEMQQLKSESKPIYENLYFEDPGEFVRRIGRYWESYSLRSKKKNKEPA